MNVLCEHENELSGSFATLNDVIQHLWGISKLKGKPVKRLTPTCLPYNFFYVGGITLHGYKYIPNRCICQEGKTPMKYSTIGERIRALREALGLSQREFGERIGRTLRGVQNYEYNKTSPDEATLILISRTFGVSLEWLKTGKGEMMLKKEEVIPTELVAVPIITSAGAGGLVFTPDHVLIERSRLKHGKVYGFKVRGDSMHPTVQDGEIVLVEENAELEDGAVVLVACGEENGLKVRRLRHIANEWWLFADNPSYAPEKLEGCKIVGRAVGVYKPAEVREI